MPIFKTYACGHEAKKAAMRPDIAIYGAAIRAAFERIRVDDRARSWINARNWLANLAQGIEDGAARQTFEAFGIHVVRPVLPCAPPSNVEMGGMA